MELQTIGLTKKFGPKTAVDHLDITLTGGVYGLLGANGAGKTTLMRLLGGLMTPTSGKIVWNGRNIRQLGEHYSQLLGYLPQQFGYYPEFTALDFLLYLAALKGLEEGVARKRCRELLEAVGLSRESRHKIKTFSGGMKQRLGIAQAMLNGPRILILDEPTAGLDPRDRVRFRSLISAFARERIVILSTHIVSDVEVIADQILMMKGGQIVECGSLGQVLEKMQGRVWECPAPAGQAQELAAAFHTGSLRNTPDGIAALRVIADASPMPGAVRVPPNLEDLYLCYFNTDGGHSEPIPRLEQTGLREKKGARMR